MTPAVVWDGIVFVVAWGRGRDYVAYHDLFGCVIGEDGAIGESFPIATGAEDERTPTLLRVAEGRTMIAYVRDAPDAAYVPRVFTRLISTPHRRRTVVH